MAATYQRVTFPRVLKPAQLRRRFEALQRQDRAEVGHCYTGRFGMADGLEIRAMPPFPDVDAADDWLSAHAERWGPALAVTALVQHPEDVAEEVWVVGAWCGGEPRIERNAVMTPIR